MTTTLLVKVDNKSREIISSKKISAKFYHICEEISTGENFSENYDILTELTNDSLSEFGIYNENIFMLKSSTHSFYIFKKERREKVYFLALEDEVVLFPLRNKKANTLLNSKGQIL